MFKENMLFLREENTAKSLVELTVESIKGTVQSTKQNIEKK
jgi:hypothetical protein